MSLFTIGTLHSQHNPKSTHFNYDRNKQVKKLHQILFQFVPFPFYACTNIIKK